MNVENQNESNEDLEYNDGLGDLLREREKLEFSWAKTSVILVLVLGVILISITFVFNSGKRFFNKQQTAVKTSAPASTKISSKPLVDSTISTPSTKAPQKENSLAKTSSIKKPKNSKSTASPYRYKVITGSFKNKSFARNQLSSLKKKGFDGFIKTVKSNGGSTLYRVQAGAYKTRNQAKSLQSRLQKHSFESHLLIK
ncbi:hypothetical protein DID78_02440 [Candidatus Marinamargulisbacteria bacterium SCGC AG-343-D04]|nr:hypothetical protein DID78_02440 [Candidatus Marinamargulisbacteria bacterium SCGC AG-343-D04]